MNILAGYFKNMIIDVTTRYKRCYEILVKRERKPFFNEKQKLKKLQTLNKDPAKRNTKNLRQMLRFS